MMTEEDRENVIPDHIKFYVEQMPEEQARARCKALSKKIDVPEHPPTLGLETPEAIPIEDIWEYSLLKKRLGENCGD